MTAQITLQHKSWPITKLIEYANNPRKNDHAVDKIAEAIQYFGFRIPIIAKSDGTVVDGHLRLKAARKLGMTKVPVILADDLTDEQIRAFRISVNKMSELADWNDDLLKAEMLFLKEMDFDMDLLGFDDDELIEIFNIDRTIEVNENDIPDIPETPITKPGDVWLLGNHKVMCGNSENIRHVGILMNGIKANLCITSPPYAMQRSDDYGGVNVDEYPIWFNRVAENIKQVLVEDGSLFVNIKEHVEDGQRSLYVFETIKQMVNSGWRYIDQLIWTKPGLPGGWKNRLKNDFEPVHFFSKNDDITWMIQPVSIDENILEMANYGFIDMYEEVFHFSKRKKIKFRPRSVGHESDSIIIYSKSNKSQGDSGNISVSGKLKKGIARTGNVLHLKGNTEQIQHSAVFPIGLPAFFIKLTTDSNDIVYEPFGGAGTTLIASEKLGRTCCAMEMLPKYCDVIVRRWQDFTGQKAIRESDGLAFDQLVESLPNP